MTPVRMRSSKRKKDIADRKLQKQRGAWAAPAPAAQAVRPPAPARGMPADAASSTAPAQEFAAELREQVRQIEVAASMATSSAEAAAPAAASSSAAPAAASSYAAAAAPESPLETTMWTDRPPLARRRRA
jgi:hypothetical protein